VAATIYEMAASAKARLTFHIRLCRTTRLCGEQHLLDPERQEPFEPRTGCITPCRNVDILHSSSQPPISNHESSIMPLKKTYFLAPNFDYPPGGLIALGGIITDPTAPENSLNEGNRVEIPASSIQHSIKTDWRTTREKLRGGKIGIWASFLQMLGLGGDIGTNYTNTNLDQFKFDFMESHYFRPDDAYLEKSLQNAEVKGYIEGTRHRKAIYMITGLRVVQGASGTVATKKGHGVTVRLGVDGSPVGVPMAVGPEMTVSSTISENTSFKGSSDYVYAYRLLQIRSRKGQKPAKKDFSKNAELYNDDHQEGDLADGLHKAWEIVEFGETGEDLPNAEMSSVADEDGEECNVVTTSRS
jgi:hypothetical protein